ncbi:hypothetical protein BconGalA64_19660 [Burkholderia contaminans]|nr:hypothetical protein BconGalA64_19660 [Burkholderia contaminans]
MTRLAEEVNLIEIKTIPIELHIFETFEPVRPHEWFRMRRMAGMAAEAVTHFRFNECESTWGVCSFPQPRGNDPLGKRNTKSAARYVAAIWPPCGSVYQVLRCAAFVRRRRTRCDRASARALWNDADDP